MAEKKKATSAKVTTRVVASTGETKKTTTKTRTTATKSAPVASKKTAAKKPKAPRDNYFIGAWRELRQVRWPDRKATWGLTFAVILYSAFFFVLIILLDALFKYLFDFLVKG